MPAWCCDAVGANGRKIAYGSAEMKAVRSRTFPGIAAAMAKQWTNWTAVLGLGIDALLTRIVFDVTNYPQVP